MDGCLAKLVVASWVVEGRSAVMLRLRWQVLVDREEKKMAELLRVVVYVSKTSNSIYQHKSKASKEEDTDYQ